MNTQPSGSTILACVGRGIRDDIRRPTDNRSNSYVQLGTNKSYTLWPYSGTGLFGAVSAIGGTGHVVSSAKVSYPTDEITLSVIEVVGGGKIEDYSWKEAREGQPLTSGTVTTRGPAVLVAWAWPDSSNAKNECRPSGDFTLIDTQIDGDGAVQCFVAVSEVSTAGTYNVTWNASPTQGAQLWVAAVSAAA
jgi:hypothetical protein